MARTAIIFSPIYYQHNTGKRHPESAKRLHAIIKEINKAKLVNGETVQLIKPEKARLEEVELVHGIEYIDLVEAVCRSSGGLLDLEDTVVSPESFNVALYAVGGTLKAIKLVIEGKFKNTFALVRPPGHHASEYCACGFCIFNNVAIGAEYLRRKYGLKRILILDIDAHHGNGTQETFYKTPEVLYISLHQDPTEFPGTGFVYEVGEGDALGYTVNIPLPYGTRDRIYLKAMSEVVEPIVMQYNPQFTLVSAGLDGHYTDPVANLSLSASCYQRIYESIIRLTSETCDGRLVSVLEGGYSQNFVGKIAVSIIARLSGTLYNVEDKAPVINKHVEKQGEKALEDVKSVQKSFWEIK
jgi:acetoin utilization deacetylase AcuC-like enzyme